MVGRNTTDQNGQGSKVEQASYASVRDALEDTPEAAANMRLRARLMIAVEQEVLGWGVTQTEAAGRLGVTQPRLSDLMRGRIDKFSLDALVELVGRSGLAVRMNIDKEAP